ncbi:MAG: hypothetical protein ACFE9T_10535 [Promethearchaeota archaeon]
MTVYESHKLKTYAFISVTICFSVPLIILTGFGIVEGGILLTVFIFLDFLILIPLSLISFYLYYFKLWIKFEINEEKFEIIEPHHTKPIYWSEFDNMKLKVKGHHVGLTNVTSRYSVTFWIHFYRNDSKRVIKYLNFTFVKQLNGKQILDLILTYSQNLGKDVILTKRYI